MIVVVAEGGADGSISVARVIGVLLLGVGAGILVGALWTAAGALWRGTANDPQEFAERTEPIFGDVRVPVNVTIIVVAVVAVIAVAVSAAASARAAIATITVAVIGAIAVLVVGSTTGLRGAPESARGPLGSGLPATVTAWYLALAGLALVLVGAILRGSGSPLRASPRVAGAVVAVGAAVTTMAVVGLPQTYASAVTLVTGDRHPVTTSIPARVVTTPESLADRGVRAAATATAIGPGFVTSDSHGVTVYNGDSLTERWRLESAGRIFRGVTVQAFPDAGIVAVALIRPDGAVQTRGVDAATAETAWVRSGRWWVDGHGADNGRPPGPGFHLLSLSDDETVLRAADPRTGADRWRHVVAPGCTLGEVQDDPREVVIVENCAAGSSFVRLAADTGAVTGSTPVPRWGPQPELDIMRGTSPIADRYRVSIEGVPVANREFAVVITERRTGREVLRSPNLSITCNAEAECLWSNADRQAVLTSLTGVFGDVVFDDEYVQETADRPVILADQVLWPSARESALIVGDRGTGRTTVLPSLTLAQAMPGGVVTRAEYYDEPGGLLRGQAG